MMPDIDHKAMPQFMWEDAEAALAAVKHAAKRAVVDRKEHSTDLAISQLGKWLDVIQGCVTCLREELESYHAKSKEYWASEGSK